MAVITRTAHQPYILLERPNNGKFVELATREVLLVVATGP